ncbi:luciferin 4-monooxygenase-like [Pectinophora gossypiella]|uniref:luciferin 4-monooxygenase-like n=1 Tax=Pectinophora gossypiella TaxID=13191 RepID=UPI00214F4AD4|nr:luciferin 4-monooxygenase-like [Pectinophora gossypiella]
MTGKIDLYIRNSESENYHLGHLFMDFMKEKSPDGIFQIDASTDEHETNGSVWQRSTQLARALRQVGLRPGAPLALSGANHLDIHIPYYAALLNGLPVVAVDPYFKYDEIRYLFKLAEPRVVFCSHAMLSTYKRIAEDLDLDLIIVTFDGDYNMAKFVEEHDDKQDIDEFQPAEFDTESVYAWLVSTSGTSGLPKVAAFKHRVLVKQIINFSRLSFIPDDGTHMGLNLAPVQWISGYYNALGMPLVNLIKLQTSNSDDLEHIIDIINKYKPSSMLSSPATMSLLLKHDKFCDLTCFTMLTITGAKPQEGLFKMLKSRLSPDAIVMDAYGQTETIGPALMPNPEGPVGSCGVPMPPAIRQIKLVDPETNEEITEANVPGELWTRGPSFAEYYNNPEETRRAFTEDGWYKSGDLLYRDERNNYFFVERIKMLIKYKNYHVNPNEIEDLIHQLDGVLEVCVVGIPDAIVGHLPAACVVLRPNATLTAQQIKDLVADKLAPSKHLRGGVIFMDKLPKTSTGKVARAKITKLAPTLKRK